jgi:hypothetical protein
MADTGELKEVKKVLIGPLLITRSRCRCWASVQLWR